MIRVRLVTLSKPCLYQQWVGAQPHRVSLVLAWPVLNIKLLHESIRWPRRSCVKPHIIALCIAFTALSAGCLCMSVCETECLTCLSSADSEAVLRNGFVVK